jgi:hypothetical protein
MSGESVEDVLTRLLRRGQLRPATAIDRIQRAGRGLTRIGIQDGLARLARDNRITGVTINGQVVGMVGWREAPIEALNPLLLDWQNAVSAIDRLDPERRGVLMRPPGGALALDEEDRQALIDCLCKISTQASKGENRYVYSATGIMGSSKALDGFPPLAELLLEKVDGERPRRPLFAITAGPAKPASVLFIENPSAFASQLRAGFPAGHLAVCAFGYGLTIENIGRRLEDGSVIACPAAGERPDLSALVKPTPCFFWGDLDLEGLRIYEALRSAIPHLKLSSIYQRMASMLSVRRTSHPYGALFGSGKAGQRPPRGDTPEVRTLARLCADRAVDQEAVCPVRDAEILVKPFIV